MKINYKHIIGIVILVIGISMMTLFGIYDSRQEYLSSSSSKALTTEVAGPVKPFVEEVGNKIEQEKEEEIVEEQKYTSGRVNVRAAASLDADIITVLDINTEVTKVGEEGDWTKIKIDDNIYYIFSKYISDEKTEIVVPIINNVENTESNNNNNNVVNDNAATASFLQTFTGYITHYGPDCAGCGGTTSSGYNVSGTIYYNDAEYGTVRIVAMSSNYPLYTIIRISNYKFGAITAIVLDRGGAIQGNKIDLLVSSESETSGAGIQTDAQIEVLRWGQ